MNKHPKQKRTEWKEESERNRQASSLSQQLLSKHKPQRDRKKEEKSATAAAAAPHLLLTAANRQRVRVEGIIIIGQEGFEVPGFCFDYSPTMS